MISSISPKIQPKASCGHALALTAVLGLAFGLHFYRLGQEGYGNLYYAAAVKSMLTNWHNFFYASFDPGGFVTVDKPPLGLWIQAASAALLGLSGFSLMLPQALSGVLAVLVLYHLVRRVFGPTAGLLAALVLTLTPINVAANRNNTMDGQLVLTSLVASWAVFVAAERGRLRYLLLGFLLVGVGFNIKMLQAYMILPALYLLYLLASPVGGWKRFWHLGLASLAMFLVSFAWVVIVDSTPADERPYIGSSQNNTVTELVFGHNGIKRLGQIAGWFGWSAPGPRPPRYALPPDSPPLPGLPPRSGNPPSPGSGPPAPGGFMQNETGAPGALRLFNRQLAGQVSWLLPLALLGLVLAPWRTPFRRPLAREHQALLFWGAWLIPMIVFFNWAGLFHRHYLEILSPAIAALVGAGVTALRQDYIDGHGRGWLLPLTLLGSALVQAGILTYFPEWASWLTPLILGGVGAAAAALFLLRFWSTFRASAFSVFPRASAAATLIAMLSLSIAPAVWATTPLWKGGHGGLPFAGPELLEQPPSPRGEADPRLMAFLLENHSRERFILGTIDAQTAAPIVLASGEAVMAMGGFTGSDPILSVEDLESMVERGEVRFFLLPGLPASPPPAGPGSRVPPRQPAPPPPIGPARQNELTNWIVQNCTPIDLGQSRPAPQPGGGMRLFDCVLLREIWRG